MCRQQAITRVLVLGLLLIWQGGCVSTGKVEVSGKPVPISSTETDLGLKSSCKNANSDACMSFGADAKTFRQLFAASLDPELAATIPAEWLSSSVFDPADPAPLWAIRTYLLGEIFLLREDKSGARKAFRSLVRWANIDPFNDSWGGSSLAAVALWRWSQLVEADFLSISTRDNPLPVRIITKPFEYMIHTLEIAANPIEQSFQAVFKPDDKSLLGSAWQSTAAEDRENSLAARIVAKPFEFIRNIFKYGFKVAFDPIRKTVSGTNLTREEIIDEMGEILRHADKLLATRFTIRLFQHEGISINPRLEEDIRLFLALFSIQVHGKDSNDSFRRFGSYLEVARDVGSDLGIKTDKIDEDEINLIRGSIF